MNQIFYRFYRSYINFKYQITVEIKQMKYTFQKKLVVVKLIVQLE